MPGTRIVHVRVLGFGLCAHLMIIVVLKKQRCWLMLALVKTCRDLFFLVKVLTPLLQSYACTIDLSFFFRSSCRAYTFKRELRYIQLNAFAIRTIFRPNARRDLAHTSRYRYQQRCAHLSQLPLRLSRLSHLQRTTSKTMLSFTDPERPTHKDTFKRYQTASKRKRSFRLR